MIATSRLQRLLGYLAADPDNLALIADTASAALDDADLGTAIDLVARYREHAAPPPRLIYIEGLAAMRSGDHGKARGAFEALYKAGHDDPALRFNLAWLSATEERYQDVVDLVDKDVVLAVPRAAALKVQALHHMGDLDAAVAVGRDLLAHLPEDDALLGAVSVAAMDADDHALAGELAARARGGADALTTQGLLALDEASPEDAEALFDRALADQPEAPRALLGKGLCAMARGDATSAAPLLEAGARTFEDHLGSWIAAGWARFLAGDAPAARRNFEAALAHDDNFAETHGGLAVLDLAAGDLDAARRRMGIALRLDKNSLGGALARTLLLDLEGRPELAQRIRERALALPIGIGGKTLVQALTGLGRVAGAPAQRSQ